MNSLLLLKSIFIILYFLKKLNHKFKLHISYPQGSNENWEKLLNVASRWNTFPSCTKGDTLKLRMSMGRGLSGEYFTTPFLIYHLKYSPSSFLISSSSLSSSSSMHIPTIPAEIHHLFKKNFFLRKYKEKNRKNKSPSFVYIRYPPWFPQKEEIKVTSFF
jgi:hypothetical protein